VKEIFFNIIYFPLPFLWLLILVLILFKKEKLYFYTKWICIFLYISLTPLFAYILEFPLKSSMKSYSENDNIKLVLVPTAGIYQDSQMKWHLSSNTTLRVSKAEELARLLNKPLLVSGGIINENSISEAEIAKQIISYNNTFYDIKSKNSYETVLNIKNYIHDTRLNEKVLIVTSPKHSLRMSLLLDSYGYENVVYIKNNNYIFTFFSLLPNARSVNSVNASIYEYLALVKYISMSYIRL